MRITFLSRILAALLLFPFSGSAQKTTTISIMGIPQEYIVPEINSDVSTVLGIRTGTCWEIFSDRNENPLYSTSEGKTAVSKAPMAESYYVTNATNEFLHVYADPAPDIKNLVLGKSAVDKGWINMHKVLLWRHCLVDGKTKRYVQAMTFSSADMFVSEESGSPNNSNGVEIFCDPDLKIKKNKFTQAKQLYFVYKIEEKAMLLGLEKRIPYGSDPKELIVGWVPVDFCYLPQTRIWIAPNDAPEALDEMNAKRVFPSVFLDPVKAARFKSTSQSEKNFVTWSFDPGMKSNGWHYFPLLTEKEGIEKVNLVDDDFKPAFAPIKTDSMEHALFKRVTLITNEELNNVILNMRCLLDSYSDNISREQIKNCFVTRLKDEYGDIEEDRLLNYSLKEIFENLYWICNSTNPVVYNTLRKLSDPDLVPDDFLRSFLEKTKKNVVELSRFTTGRKNELTFVSNDTRYFWVDLNLFY